jgi:ABC-type nitrate/sulfonate/bicarbonate transport system substrate-binding protein
MVFLDKKTIFIGAVKSIVWWTLCVADGLDLFAKAWLSVKILRYQNGREVLDALVDKSIDVAVSWAIPYEALERDDIVCISKVAEGRDTQVVLDANIWDLSRGRSRKKIWIIPNTASSKARESFQLSHAIASSKIILIEMNAYDMPSSFARWLIDGFAVWEPFVSYAKSLLGNSITVFSDNRDSYTRYMNLFIRQESQKKEQERLLMLQDVFLMTNNYIRNNKDESISLISLYTQVPSDIINMNRSRYAFYT